MKQLRFSVFAALALLWTHAFAATSLPEFGIDKPATGSHLNLYIRDPVLGAGVPTGYLNTTTHLFYPATNGLQVDPNFVTRSLRLGTNALAVQAADSTGSNIAIGPDTLPLIQYSNAMIAIGDRAGGSFTDGASLTGRTLVAVGHLAAMCQDGTSSNTAIGGFAMRGVVNSSVVCTNKVTGNDNTAVGEAAMLNLQGDANFNQCIGFNCLFGLRDGDDNTAMGDGAGLSVLTTCCNSFYGVNSYEFGAGGDNVFIGMLSGAGSTTFTSTNGAIIAGATVIPFADTSIFHVNDVLYNGALWPGLGVKVTAVTTNTSITVDTPSFIGAGANVLVRDIPDQHTGTLVTCVGYNSCNDISGDATQWATVGDGSFPNAKRAYRLAGLGHSVGSTCVTCSDVILLGNLADVPASNTTNYLNIGSTIYATGINNGVHTDDLVGIGQPTPAYTLDVAGTVASRGTSARVIMERNTLVTASAPGAGNGSISFVCGTNAGTLKLVAVGGTSTTRQTVLDNIGTGVTGC